VFDRWSREGISAMMSAAMLALLAIDGSAGTAVHAPRAGTK
jgi:hypothetical protein